MDNCCDTFENKKIDIIVSLPNMCINSGTDVVYFFMQTEDDFTGPVNLCLWFIGVSGDLIQCITAGDELLL